jgi:lysophospholipase L1-like esterase
MTISHNRARYLTILGFGITAAAGCGIAARSGSPQTRPAAVTDKWAQHYYERVAQFEKENAAARNIVLVGSSHVEGFDANKLLPGRRVVNRGIASDRIGIGVRGVLHRLDSSVFDCNPGFIILENGVNDLGELWRNGTPSMDEIEVCYRQVVTTIRRRLPNVPLVIVGLFPTRGRFAPLAPYILEFNKRLARIAGENGCRYLELFKPLADDQNLLREGYSRDGLHLNDAGYRLWARMIEEILPPLPPDTQPDRGSRRWQPK